MFRKFPDTIAPITFFPAGLSFGYLFFLPFIHKTIYDEVSYWTFFAMLFAILLTTLIISIIKFNNGKYVFEHFSYLLTSNLLFILAGVLFIILNIEYKHAALFTCVVAAGIVYVAGISYTNIRSNKNERGMRIGMCHAWKLVGVAVTLTLYTIMLDSNAEDALETFYKMFGYVMIGSSVLFIGLMSINEILQRRGLMYNYRDCLDLDNSIANNYCKIFSKHEVIIEPIRQPSNGTWKSTENLMMDTQPNFTNLWTFYMMIPKLLGAIVFNFFLYQATLRFSVDYITNDWYFMTMAWIMAGGSIVGTILLRFYNAGKLYTLYSLISIVALGTSYVLMRNEKDETVIGLWIFYCLSAASISIPDIALMEISKIRFNEFAYTIGNFIEIIPLALLQYLQRKSFSEDVEERDFLITIIITIIILLLTSLIFLLHMPNTYGKSLLQIQNELLKFNKYFAFNFDSNVASKSSAPIRQSNNSSQYHSNNINVFENSQTSRMSTSTDYVEVEDRLPDPPLNKTTNFDYNSEIIKTQKIIPRVNIIAKSSPY